jgi:hypothetical protein
MFEDTHGRDGVKTRIRKREHHRVATSYESVSKFSYQVLEQAVVE